MKGKLKQKEDKWFVEYLVKHEFLDVHLDKTEVKELPLHPDSSLTDIYIGIIGEEVEFEIVQYIKPKFAGREDKTLKDYAKLIQPKQKDWQQEATDYYKDEPKEETWDDIFKEFGKGKSTEVRQDIFRDWLKQNYHSPKKK